MQRDTFIQYSGLFTAGILLNRRGYAAVPGYVSQRPSLAKRHFTSKAVEQAITEFKANVKDKELCWLFENCFPNTLDTTVFYDGSGTRPDTYVITGDIDAMWLRDSSAQVWPYLPFTKTDEALKQMIAGVINRQTACILKDPYANAFYKDEFRISEWKSDHTEMKPGIHERKYEIDSLCYPIRLAYHYYKTCGDRAPFDAAWKQAIQNILKVFKTQQRKNGPGPYYFQRNTTTPSDTQSQGGYGNPVKPVGLICSMFRPSDDATVFSLLIPSNFFAVLSLRQAAQMINEIYHDHALSYQLQDFALEVEQALQHHAIVNHPVHGRIYAFEVDGFGNANMMDDANIPGLLALPYLGAVEVNDPVYQNTRRFVLSDSNPYYYKGKYGEGIGGPHVGRPDMIWPLSIIARGLTTGNPDEIKQCLAYLKQCHAGTGLMHESYHKDDPTNFTRKWFAWANTIFGEFLWKVFTEQPELL